MSCQHVLVGKLVQDLKARIQEQVLVCKNCKNQLNPVEGVLFLQERLDKLEERLEEGGGHYYTQENW